MLTGGLIGAFVFITGNGINSSIQNRVNNSNSFINSDKDVPSTNNNKDGPFPAKSIIEDGDSVDNIMNLLYFSLAISLCILLLVILLVFLYKNKTINPRIEG